jgi:hypothetical protein
MVRGGTSPAATVWVSGHCHACGQDCPGKCVAAVPGATRPPSAPARDVWRQGHRSLRAVRTPRAHAAMHTQGTSLATLAHRLAAHVGSRGRSWRERTRSGGVSFLGLPAMHRPAHWGRTLVPSGVPGGWHTSGTGVSFRQASLTGQM